MSQNTQQAKSLSQGPEVVETQLAENLRFYGNARFQQLTLFMAGLTAITAGMVHDETMKPFIYVLSLRAVLAIFGMLFTAVIWVMEVRSTIYWTIHWSCARHIWPLPATPWCEWLTASSAVAGLYFFTYIALWLCAYQWQVPWWLLVSLVLPFVVVLIFTAWMYLGLQRLFKRYEHEQVKLE